MVLGENGTVRTSGWTFHNREQEEQANYSAGADRAVGAVNRDSIIARIHATSDRFQSHRILRAAGLPEPDWRILFQALIEAESNYRPTALSPKGAYGLGQLMPETARALGVDRRDMTQNLDGAARYLLTQLAAFNDIDLALAAYNAGPHRVIEYGGVPPFAETRSYLNRIHQIRSRLSRRLGGQSAPHVSIRGTVRPAVVLDLN